ncbi:hypothetical protein THOM_3224 [Trachipleistophora hominis]|uniref:Uncharacterized protein n=1 Tax=Trachipleistophora hominis TaxID=72359 RepID=L7JQY6_TRAHO|nr:hypothetical protein THOM_3224 [Trachipleistophora hominis]
MVVLFLFFVSFARFAHNSGADRSLGLFCPQQDFFTNSTVETLINEYITDLSKSSLNDNTIGNCQLAQNMFNSMVDLIDNDRVVYKEELRDQFSITMSILENLKFTTKCAGFYSILHVLLTINIYYYNYMTTAAVKLVKKELREKMEHNFKISRHIFKIYGHNDRMSTWKKHKEELEYIFKNIFQVASTF